MRSLSELKGFLLMPMRGQSHEIIAAVARRVYSCTRYIVLRRDLSIPLEPPRAKCKITVRPIQESDIAQIVRALPRRLGQLRANIPTCYVAASPDNTVCYIQWLVARTELGAPHRFLQRELGVLKDDEVLLESAHTFEEFRGQGIMASAMAEIAAKGTSLGARAAVTFVLDDNIAALKGCKNAGFTPYMIQEVNWKFFRRQVLLKDLPEPAYWTSTDRSLHDLFWGASTSSTLR